MRYQNNQFPFNMTLKESATTNHGVSTAPSAPSESQNGIVELTPVVAVESENDTNAIPFATATAMGNADDHLPTVQPIGVGPPLAYATGPPRPPVATAPTQPTVIQQSPAGASPQRYGRNNDGSCTCCCITCIIVTVVVICCVIPLILILVVFAVATSAIADVDDDFWQYNGTTDAFNGTFFNDGFFNDGGT